MKRKILFPILISTLLASCGEKTPVVTGPPELVNPPVVVEDIVVPVQHDIVTPEFWTSFDTDLKVVYYYSKIDSMQTNLPKVKEATKIFCNTNNIAYHEYYTNDNMGLVQLNDSLFFDLTEYLTANSEGFLFLKKGMIENHPGAEANGLDKFLTEFFN